MLRFAAAAVALASVLATLQSSPPRLDASAAIPYVIENGRSVPGYRDTDRELARFALDAWSRESGGVLTFSEASAAMDALIRVRWVSSGGGTYGETEYVRVNGKPGAIVNVMPDVSLQGEPLAGLATADVLLRDTIVYLTCVHELGHAVGLQHTRNFDDIMFYFGYGGDVVQYFMRYRTKLNSRDDIRKYSGLSDGDRRALHDLYAR
jgi:Matrixin